MIGYLTGLIGVWIMSDGIYSILLYYQAPSHRGDKQNWAKDHSIRLVRIAGGVALVILGWLQIA